jgi:hypothetical protein
MLARPTRLVTAMAEAAAVLALAACGAATVPSAPSPPPKATVTVKNPNDDHGLFFMATQQTLLLLMANASSRDSAVLPIAGHYANATLFRAAAVGRTTVTGLDTTHCPTECNTSGPLQITVVVVSPEDLQRGVVVSEQDHSWEVHLRRGQLFVLTLRNQPGGPPWTRLTSADPAVIASAEPPLVTAAGIQGRFRAAQQGRTGVYATGLGCSLGACAQSPYFGFTFVVFA